MADHTRRGELCVAFDELEPDPELACDRTQQGRLPGAGWTLDDDVTIGRDRCDRELDLTHSADDRRRQTIDELVESAGHDRSGVGVSHAG